MAWNEDSKAKTEYYFSRKLQKMHQTLASVRGVYDETHSWRPATEISI